MIKPQNLTGFKKVAVKVGGFVLSAMVADKATDYVGETIDKTVNEHDIRVPLGIEWITGKNWYMCH